MIITSLSFLRFLLLISAEVKRTGKHGGWCRMPAEAAVDSQAAASVLISVCAYAPPTSPSKPPSMGIASRMMAMLPAHAHVVGWRGRYPAAQATSAAAPAKILFRPPIGISDSPRAPVSAPPLVRLHGAVWFISHPRGCFPCFALLARSSPGSARGAPSRSPPNRSPPSPLAAVRFLSPFFSLPQSRASG